MDSHFSKFFTESVCSEDSYAHNDIERCPFVRNINEPTNFSFASLNSAVPVRGANGPIFEDGPDFEKASRQGGGDGVVPLSGRSLAPKERLPAEREQVHQFNGLAAKAATISLSSFGVGAFGFDFFSKPRQEPPSSQKGGNSSHEAMSTWQCLISKSYGAASSVLPLVAKASNRPPGAKLRRPPATVAARAALARTARVKNPGPESPHGKILAVALLGMAANFPLGVWMERTQKNSPQWFAAGCSVFPFVVLPESAALMPKTAMAFSLGASLLGRRIGAIAERMRLKALPSEQQTATNTNTTGHCSDGKACAPVPFKGNASMHPSKMPPPEGKLVSQNVSNISLFSIINQTCN